MLPRSLSYLTRARQSGCIPSNPSKVLFSSSPELVSLVKLDEEPWNTKYKWISGVEALEGYRPGGYHPIMIDDILHDRYHVVDKLRFGGYSTLWLARDSQLNQYVAVKVGTAKSTPRETKILRDLSDSALESPSKPSYPATRSSLEPDCRLIPSVMDEFELSGPNGIHACYITMAAQSNLWETSYSRLFSREVARAISAALVLTVAYVHSRGYIHGGE